MKHAHRACSTPPHAAPFLGGALALLHAALAHPAHADVVQSPPDDCPAGSVGVTSHAGQWCAARPCTSDAECAPPPYDRTSPRRICRELSLCVRSEQYTPGGWHQFRYLQDPDLERPTRHVAVGPCGAGCEAPAACQTGRFCAPADAAPAPPSRAAPSSAPPDPSQPSPPAAPRTSAPAMETGGPVARATGAPRGEAASGETGRGAGAASGGGCAVTPARAARSRTGGHRASAPLLGASLSLLGFATARRARASRRRLAGRARRGPVGR